MEDVWNALVNGWKSEWMDVWMDRQAIQEALFGLRYTKGVNRFGCLMMSHFIGGLFL